MITITLDPIIFSIGHLHIRWYSLIVLAAISVGTWQPRLSSGASST